MATQLTVADYTPLRPGKLAILTRHGPELLHTDVDRQPKMGFECLLVDVAIALQRHIGEYEDSLEIFEE